MTAAPSRYVLAVSLEPLDATTTLFFGHLEDSGAGALRVVRDDDPDLAAQLAGASAVVLIRALFEMEKVEWTCRQLGVPLYYFVDDNFMVLREQSGAWSPFVGRYSVANVRDRLRGFAGVMLSSPSLIEYFDRESLHPALTLFPPVAWPKPLSPPASRPATLGIGFFGGKHLHSTFREVVMPAIERLAATRPVRLIIAGLDTTIAASPGVTIAAQPYEASYAAGLASLGRSGIDVLVHPSVAGLANNQYKNPHALISAHALGAVPVVSDRPPYDHLRDEGVVLSCDDRVDSWHAALAQAADVDAGGRIRERLADYCTSHFDGAVNRHVVATMIDAHPAPAAGATRWRRIHAAACLAAARLRGRLQRFGS
jgi:hypothetical protein